MFSYSYGDFPADPYEVLKKHFDAFLYMANSGSRRLGFRFPASAMDLKALRGFAMDDTISVEKVGAHVLVDLSFENEDDSDWIGAFV